MSCCDVDCSRGAPRERATVRSTIYNQIGFVCVRVCAHVMHRTNTRDAGDTGTRRARQ